jgi:glycosyltransferase involved in cell wall biosynthesis
MTYRIIFIITGLDTGGAERMLLKLLQNLNRNVYTPSVISLSSRGDIGLQIEKLGINVLTLGMSPSKFEIRKFFLLVKYIRSIKPSLVHTWMYHADLLGGIAAKISRVQHIIWSIRQSNLSSTLNSKTTLKIVKLCAWLSFWIPEKILCNSNVARSKHEAIGYSSRKMLVIPNGFNLSEFSKSAFNGLALRNKLGVANDAPLVGLVARFDSQKNHFGFIQAAKIIHNNKPDVHFLLVGSGIDKENITLYKWIIDNKLEQVIHLLGKRDDIPHLMSIMNLLISSSDGESFPNVIGEAMACSVPCVVTDVGDCAEIVGNTGCVVDAGDMEHLAQSVLNLLELSEIEINKLGEMARKRVEVYYEISAIVSRYQNMYLQTINGVV